MTLRSRLIGRQPGRADSAAAAPDGTVPAIDLVGLAKAFDGHQVLRGVDLTVRPGESLTIIGGSGIATWSCTGGAMPSANRSNDDPTPGGIRRTWAAAPRVGRLPPQGMPVTHSVTYGR